MKIYGNYFKRHDRAYIDISAMPVTFSELDDPTSEVFRNTLSSQEEYINDKLSKTKKRIFNDKCGQVGDIKTITDSNSSDARNIVHEFFTGKNYKVNTCLCCDGKIGEKWHYGV